MAILITGGAGFIGSNFVLDWFSSNDEMVINVDKLTYAGNLANLEKLENDSRYDFIKADVNDGEQISQLLKKNNIRAIIHFAAESHVDRSIQGPEAFIRTNIDGTFRLLETARHYFNGLDNARKESFRFLHVSTDEVYGSLTPEGSSFTEEHPYAPNNPYSASKAAADHLVRAYYQSYDLPVLTTNCSNNYGPFQFPEKLIPLCILNALSGKQLPIYGDGQQIRDWLYVADHCTAIRTVLNLGRPGEVYNIGGWNEKTNIDVVQTFCSILDELVPRQDQRPYASQITYIKDRPGHDRRYAIDATKIARELDWKPQETFNSGILKTIQWYLAQYQKEA